MYDESDPTDPTDPTVRQRGTLRGVGPEERPSSEDVGSALTVLPTDPRATKPLTSPSELESTRYRLGALLGQGGMGEVVLAYDDQIGREVAVKRIRSGDPSGEELSRFVREARVQGRLEHPAVVPVHDLAFDRTGRPYFVMKRLTGTTMADMLAKVRAGDDADEAATRRVLLRAFADVCLAIEFAHRAGVIHRDLKPSNIMLGDFGEVYVIDWGIARAVTEPDDSGVTPSGQHDLKLEGGDTQLGTVLGTPAYMSPEQLTGERVGPAADIYALGCILYEIAAGEALHRTTRHPAEAIAPVEARPTRKRPDSPPELDAVCERATAPSPQDRYPSARALGDAVQAFLDGDRDVAVRRELAQHHIAEARAALAKGSDEVHRRAAMRAAGRALALDPTAADAADLVTQLMLVPPKQMPAEVEDRLATIDTENARTQGRLAALSMIGYLAFVPILLWAGVRDWRFVAAFVALAIGSGVQVWRLTRRDRITTGGIYVNACINALLIGLVCRMVGPFIIAPTLVTTTLMAYAAHPQFGRIRILAIILGSAVVVPWVLEAVGVLSKTYKFEGGELRLTSEVIRFSAAPVQVAFAVLLVALLAVVGLLSRAMAMRQRAARRELELQAWHLRQMYHREDGR